MYSELLVSLFIAVCLNYANALLTLKANFQAVTDGEVVTVNEYQNLEIECATNLSLVEVTLTTIPDIEHLLLSGPRGSVQNFTLPNVNRTLNGTVFSCTDNTNTLDFSIEVQYIPSYIFLMGVYSLFENEPLTLTATVDANPQPNNVTWTRNGQVVLSGSGISTTLNSISFTSLARDDNGTYTITSNNGVGEGSGSFDLIVYYGPEFTGGNNGSTIYLTRSVGQRLIINCTVASSNPTEITITITLPNSTTVSSSIHIEDSVTSSNQGTYTCTASTSVGFATLIYSISVNEVSPSATLPSSTTTTMTPSVTPSDSAGLSCSLFLIIVASVIAALQA